MGVEHGENFVRISTTVLVPVNVFVDVVATSPYTVVVMVAGGGREPVPVGPGGERDPDPVRPGTGAEPLPVGPLGGGAEPDGIG